MPGVDDDALTEANHRGETLLLEDLVRIVERAHAEEAGVSRERLATYGEGLEPNPSRPFDRDAVVDAVEARLTDSESWVDVDTLYELPSGNVSRFPARWHEDLAGETDPRRYLRYLREEVDGFADSLKRGGAGDAIPEDLLIDIVTVVGRVGRDDAKARIEELRSEGEIVEDTDQHPQAGVHLPEDTDEQVRDPDLG